MLGRGTDIKPQHENGMFCIQTFLAPPRDTDQIAGRVARNGAKGEYLLLVGNQEVKLGGTDSKQSIAEKMQQLVEQQIVERKFSRMAEIYFSILRIQKAESELTPLYVQFQDFLNGITNRNITVEEFKTQANNTFKLNIDLAKAMAEVKRVVPEPKLQSALSLKYGTNPYNAKYQDNNDAALAEKSEKWNIDVLMRSYNKLLKKMPLKFWQRSDYDITETSSSKIFYKILSNLKVLMQHEKIKNYPHLKAKITGMALDCHMLAKTSNPLRVKDDLLETNLKAELKTYLENQFAWVKNKSSFGYLLERSKIREAIGALTNTLNSNTNFDELLPKIVECQNKIKDTWAFSWGHNNPKDVLANAVAALHTIKKLERGADYIGMFKAEPKPSDKGNVSLQSHGNK